MSSIKSEDEVLRRHRAFWQGRGLLLHTKPYVPAREVQVPLAHGGIAEGDVYLQPDMLDPLDFVPAPNDADRATTPWPMEGDVLKIKGPFKIPWTEAIMGCPVKLVPASGATWSESFLTGLEDIERLRLKPDNPWLRKLADFAQVLAEHSNGRYVTTHTTMRGPIDMADAMLGTSRLAMALLDKPDKIRALLEICTEAFIETARAQWAVIPPSCGGHASRYGVWAPGEVTRTQADAAGMISPRLYREVVLPFDLKVLRAFPYSIMHTHSTYLHVAEAFLEKDVPSAIQVGYDEPPFGPPVDQLLPVLKRILKHKPLIFHGVVHPSQVDLLTNELPPNGLLLDLLIRQEEPCSPRH
jgi:hypothetical protein